MEGMGQAPGGEQVPARHSKVQRKRRSREACTQHPGDTTVAWRGSARAATMASSQRKTPMTRRRNNQLTKPKHHRGWGLATQERAWGRHGRSPELQRWKGMQAMRMQSSRSHGQVEPPSPDLSIERHLGGGGRRSSLESSTAAARRRSRQESRERGEEQVSEEERRRPVWTDWATGRVRPVGWSNRWARHGSERERWREEFLTRKL
jgi:hypothetical protein